MQKSTFFIPSLLTGIIMILSTPTVHSQNLVIDSIAVPPVAYSCSNTVVTVYTTLYCINYTHVGNTSSVTGFSIGINVTHNYSPICLFAISYPTHIINLGMLPAGTYTITTTGTLVGVGVVSSNTKTLVVADCCPNAAFDATFDVNDTIICKNDSVICTNTGTGVGLTHKWYVDGVYSANTTNFTSQLTTVGNHDIKLVTDSASCQRSKTTDITVVGYPTLNIGADRNICVGDKTTLNAGSGWDSLYWSTAETTQTIIAMDSGNYSLIARDVNHCKIQYDTLHVSFKPTPFVEFGNDTTLCVGDTLLLDATNSGAAYLWHDNSIGATFQVTQSGKYWVRANFTNNCATTDTINIDYAICTGIDEQDDEAIIEVLPNPFSDFITVNNSLGKVLKNVSIHSSSGARVYSSENLPAFTRIDVSHLPSGSYILYLQYEDIQRSFKLIKIAQ